LGLALVRDILQAHGSVIEVESEEGKGSTFQFPLLLAKDGRE
jgi:signal transduction histidine kinase